MKICKNRLFSLPVSLLVGGLLLSITVRAERPGKAGIIRAHGEGFYEIKPDGLKVLQERKNKGEEGIK